MIRRLRSKLANSPAASPPFLLIASAMFVAALYSYGCKRNAHTSDPHLQQIDEMLNTHLPPGTPRARVGYFLISRGFKLDIVHDKYTVIALVRHVDTDTLQPATARVTFHFDSNDKLTTYELQPAPDNPLEP